LSSHADPNLSFLVQSLENVGEDITSIAPAIGDRAVSAAIRQRALMERVDRVSIEGRSLASPSSRVRLRQLRREFVLEVDLLDRDSAGRIVPVLCYGELLESGSSDWPQQVAVSLEAFVRSSGLTIDDELSSTVAVATQTLIDNRPQSLLGSIGRRIASNFSSVTPDSTGPLPARPEERRMIVALTEGEKEALRASTEGERLRRDASVALVTIPVRQAAIDASPVLGDLERVGALERGAVLLQSPFDPNRYFPAETAAAELAATKLQVTSDLCRHLGAETVELTEVTLESRAGTARYQAKAQRGLLEAETEHSRTELQSFVKRVQLHDRFRGGPPDLARAHELLARSGIGDPHLLHLVKLRGEGNPLLEREFDLSTSEEVGRANRWIAKAAAALTRFEASARTTADEIAVYELTLRVTFPDSG
jgi:hypothetical protein